MALLVCCSGRLAVATCKHPRESLFKTRGKDRFKVNTHAKLHETILLVEKGSNILEDLVEIAPRNLSDGGRRVAFTHALMSNDSVYVL